MPQSDLATMQEISCSYAQTTTQEGSSGRVPPLLLLEMQDDAAEQACPACAPSCVRIWRLTPGKLEASSSQGQLQEVHHPALAACHHRHALAGQPGKLAAGEARVRHEEAVNSPCNADKELLAAHVGCCQDTAFLLRSLLCKLSCYPWHQ